jgi:hypothetical protein
LNTLLSLAAAVVVAAEMPLGTVPEAAVLEA